MLPATGACLIELTWRIRGGAEAGSTDVGIVGAERIAVVPADLCGENGWCAGVIKQ